MKKKLLIIIVVIFALPIVLQAQDRSALRAARMSFNSAENNYKEGNYKEAAHEYTIVVNTIPVSIDSRRYLELRLQSVIGLVDIFFNKTINFEQACKYVDLYVSDMKTVTAGDVLRASDRLNYLRKEQEFNNNYVSKCKTYRRSEYDIEEFRKHFEEQLRKED